MMEKLKQIIPQEVCLACHGCCRFIEPDSPWRPVLVEDDLRRISEAVTLDSENKIKVAPHQDLHLCPFLCVEDNHCKVYENRPFDCQLYPFLLIKKEGKALLALDKKCPYAEMLLNHPRKARLFGCLEKELKQPASVQWLKQNPGLFGAYNDEEVLELAAIFDWQCEKKT